MKKLMILAAATMIAAVTHASSVYWTCTNVYSPDGENKNTGIAYFINAGTISQTALLGYSVDELKTALANNYSYSPNAAGTYSKAATQAVKVADLGLADKTDYTGVYLAIFDGSSIDDSTKVYLTQEMALSTLDGENSAQVKFGTQATASKANWTAIGVDVPEPTSGLLLLLGVAGLALKRKRA